MSEVTSLQPAGDCAPAKNWTGDSPYEIALTVLGRRMKVAGIRLPEHTLPIHRVGFFSARDEEGAAVELVYTSPGTALRLPYDDTLTSAVTG